MKTERSFVDGSVRTLKNGIQVHFKRLIVNILRRVQFTKFELHRSKVDQCDFPVVVQLHYLIYGLKTCRVKNVQQSRVWSPTAISLKPNY